MAPTPLTRSVVYRDVRLGERERRHLDSGVARLDAWTRHFPDRSLRVTLDQQRRDGGMAVQLVLELANKTLVAQGQSPHLLGALDDAFRKVTRQLREFKALLRRDHLHGRSRGLQRAGPNDAASDRSAAALERDLEAFRISVVRQLDGLVLYLRDQLTSRDRHGQRVDVMLEDLVDDVLAAAFDAFAEKPMNLTNQEWLLRTADVVLEGHAARRDAPTVDVDARGDVPVPPSASDDPYDGLHRLHFGGDFEPGKGHHPPEPRILHVAADDPAEMAESEEFMERVRKLLRELPAAWRRCWTMYVDGVHEDAISEALGTDPTAVRYALRSAELFLREHLARDLGLEPTHSR